MSVPALRFQGFSDSWVETKVGEITSKVGSGSTPRGGVEVYQSTGIPFIRSQNVNNEQLLLDDITFISDEINNHMKGSLVKANDILLNITGASIGRSCVVPSDFEIGNVNQHVCIVRLKSEYVPRFLQPYLSSSRGQKSISSTQVGSGREGLNFEAIKSFKVSVPELLEQTKISNFLTAIDEKISFLTQKYDLLTQYKNGVMQKIFSQELRFKDDDGQDFPEWKNEELRMLCDLITKGTTPTSVGHEFKTSGINFIKIESLEVDGKLIKEKLGFIDSDTHAKLLRSQLKLNDLLFSIAGALGRVAIVTDEFLPANTNQALAIIRLSKGTSSDTKFVFYALTNEGIKKLIESISVQLAQANLSLKNIGDFVIQLPCLKEQKKVANFLTAIDDKITATQAQLKAVKQYKQGLLQQMFV